MDTQQQEPQEHGSVTAFFEDLAKTREKGIRWVLYGNMTALLRTNAEDDCDCPLVAVAKFRGITEDMHGHPLRNDAGYRELAQACNVSPGFAGAVMSAADVESVMDGEDEVRMYCPELRARLLKAVGIIEA